MTSKKARAVDETIAYAKALTDGQIADRLRCLAYETVNRERAAWLHEAADRLEKRT